MSQDLLIIAITSPYFFPGEADRINTILSSGEADLLHIRKPNSTFEEVENLILNIDSNFYSKIKLHDHFSLVEKFPLRGVHLNSRNPKPHPKAKNISCSIHSLSEIGNSDAYEYFFLSPIFESISKPGYKSNFNLGEIKDKIMGKKAIALGGVTPNKFPMLTSLGFYGAAMLGHFFKNNI